MANHKVAHGTFKIHEHGNDACDQCSRPAALHIDLGDGTRLIARTFLCKDEPVDFSHGLQIMSPELKEMLYIIRTCTAHANFHIHRTNRFSGRRDLVQERFTLDTREDVSEAYRESAATLMPNVGKWRKQWSQKQSRTSGRK